MPDKDYTTLKVKIRTKKELLKMQAGYQIQFGARITIDQIIWTFIQKQPVVNAEFKEARNK